VEMRLMWISLFMLIDFVLLKSLIWR